MTAVNLRLIANGGETLESDTPNMLDAAVSNVLDYELLTEGSQVYRSKDYGVDYFDKSCQVSGSFNISAMAGAVEKSFAVGFSSLLGSLNTASQYNCGLFHGANTSTTVLDEYVFACENGGWRGTSVASFSGSLNAEYYYSFLLDTALHKFGRAIGIYWNTSDKTATPYKKAGKNRTSNYTFRYLIFNNYYVSARSSTITGKESDVDVKSIADGTSDLSAGDIGNQTGLDNVANCITGTARGHGSAGGVGYDMGAGYYGSNLITVDFAFRVDAQSGYATYNDMGHLIAFSTNADGAADLDECVSLYWEKRAGNTFALMAEERQIDTVSAVARETPYQDYGVDIWATAIFDPAGGGTYGTFSCQMYNDQDKQSPIGNGVSIQLTQAIPDRYFYAFLNNVFIGGQTTTFVIGGVTHTDGGAQPGAMSETVALAETPAASIVRGEGATSEAVNFIETVSSSVIAPIQAIAEQMALNVTLAASYITGMVVTEAMSLSALQWAALPGEANMAEALSLVDTPDAYVMAPASMSETLAFAETVTSIISGIVYTRRSWKIIKWDAATQSYIPLINPASLPRYEIFQPSTGLNCDFEPGENFAFKPYASCISPDVEMQQRSAANHPGWFDYDFMTGNLLDGKYEEQASLLIAPNYFSVNYPEFRGGVLVFAGLTSDESARLFATPSALQNANAAAALISPQIAALPSAADIVSANRSYLGDGEYTLDEIARLDAAVKYGGGKMPTTPGPFEFRSPKTGVVRIAGEVLVDGTRIINLINAAP